MRLAFYGRVSTQRQEKEETIENQLLVVKEKFEKEGHVFVKDYIDENWSGMVLERPDLDQLRLDAASDLWEGIAMYDTDRLSRKYMHLCILQEEFEKAGKQLLFVTIKTPENDEDRLMFGIKGLFSEYERYKISERFRLGKLRKARSGQLIISHAPFGYRLFKKTDKEHTRIEIEPYEAEVIKMIFTWLGEEGCSIREVIRRLTDKGIQPRKSMRKVWATSTINNFIHNETYMGTAYFGKSKAIEPKNPLKIEKYKRIKKTSRVLRPKEDWILIKVPTIITEELYNKVRARMEVNSKFAPKNKKHEYLLTSLVACPCGYNRVGEQGRYYRCSQRIYTFPVKQSCTEGGVDSSMLDSMVWQEISQLLLQKDLILDYYNRWTDSLNAKHNTYESQVKPLERGLDSLERESARYVKAFGAGLLDFQQFQELKVELDNKRLLLQAQISVKESSADEAKRTHLTEGMVDTYCQFASAALNGLSFQQKQEILRTVVEKVTATQKEAIIYGYIPVKKLNTKEDILNVEQRPIHRNHWIA